MISPDEKMPAHMHLKKSIHDLPRLRPPHAHKPITRYSAHIFNVGDAITFFPNKTWKHNPASFSKEGSRYAHL